MSQATPALPTVTRKPLGVIPIIVGAALGWMLIPTMLLMADRWDERAEYSHGWLIPVFSLGILWFNRVASAKEFSLWPTWLLCGGGAAAVVLADRQTQSLVAAIGVILFCAGAAWSAAAWFGLDRLTSDWIGAALLVLSTAGLITASRMYIESVEQLCIPLVVTSAAWALGGWRFIRWCWPATIYLAFMVPLPFSLETSLREPLRMVGTHASTYIMQTIGLPAFSEGNVIVVGDHRLGVAEACSGLRMLMVFVAASVAVVFIGRRPWWQNILVLVSSVPIALISNIARITVTGIFHTMGWEKLADMTFHDLAGWCMMPLGLAMLALELWYLDNLILIEVKRPMAVGLNASKPS